jgi:uncharacterized protein YndB with AHSA1/START domain
MLAFEASSTIAATPAKVWAVLVQGDEWPSWDSGVASVEGSVALGKKLRIQSKVAPGRTFTVKVTKCDAPRGMEFTGGMPFGLFKGVRTYTLVADKSGGTLFTMREAYTGPMAASIGKSIPDLNPSFQQFASGLKARVESSS